jgi:hypothetical protein
MLEDRIILTEEMDYDIALDIIKSLPFMILRQNRHKFVFTKHRELIIGRADRGNPRHRDLGDPVNDKIAGYISFNIEENRVNEIYINNVSRDFNYPRFELLFELKNFLTGLFNPECLDMENHPKIPDKIIILPSSVIH